MKKIFFNIFKKGRQAEENAAQNLYKTLCVNTYTQYPYDKQSLGEEMYVIKQVIGEYWKPRYLVDEKNKTAIEFMSHCAILQTVTVNDIDWDSLQGLPEKAIRQARTLNAVFPTFIRKYNDGIASVDWELNPDGRYYMDEDGFGMTNDNEITIYGFIDRNGKPLVKFRAIKDFKELDMMEKDYKATMRNGHELKNMHNPETSTLDICSNGLYPSNVLGNMCSNGFRFNRMICGSIEVLSGCKEPQ